MDIKTFDIIQINNKWYKRVMTTFITSEKKVDKNKIKVDKNEKDGLFKGKCELQEYKE